MEGKYEETEEERKRVLETKPLTIEEWKEIYNEGKPLIEWELCDDEVS